MTEPIRSFKQDIDRIEVPLDKLDAIITQTVQQPQQGPAGRVPVKRKRWALRIAMTAAVSCGLLLGSAAVSPAMAGLVSQIPLLGSIFSQSEDIGLKQVSDQGLSTAVGQSQTSGDVSLTIDEVFYDGTRFTIGYSLQSEKPLTSLNGFSRMDVTVNGKALGFAGGDKRTELSPSYVAGIFDLDAFDGLPERFMLGLSFQGEGGKQWDFSLPVSLSGDVTRLAIDHKQEASGIELNISNLKIGPAGIRLFYQTVADETSRAEDLEFRIVDEHGQELPSHSGGSTSERKAGIEYGKGSRLYDPAAADTKELTITPYLTKATDGGGVALDDAGQATPVERMPGTADDITFQSFTVTLP
ncbi:DUF4179 domain-containing protein [Paenibacillus donghaensis]|uniref:DUF4179 domain-containing protein n=1 Tax=Paenibacillus donghaensis TaxID=414771 RepID=A0A2Z2KKF3_9BACL|nr:DUF4179 domain-containing protein [Paenibacillus donghaensis]ASA24715.1 hypothetical protein B9T62_30545 [Paenibacillus donghaensis]